MEENEDKPISHVLDAFAVIYPWARTIDEVSKEPTVNLSHTMTSAYIQALVGANKLELDRSSQTSKFYRYVHPAYGKLGRGPLMALRGPSEDRLWDIESNNPRGRRLMYLDVSYVLEKKLVGLARQFDPEAIISINRGGSIVGGLLAKQLQKDDDERHWLVPYNLHIVAKQDSRPDNESASMVLPRGIELPENASRILLVDDTFNSGRHLRAAYDYLEREYKNKKKTKVKTLVLLWNVAGTPEKKDPSSPIISKDGKESLNWGYRSFQRTAQPWDWTPAQNGKPLLTIED